MRHKYFHDNTFYLLILDITCSLHYPRRHNVNAWFVNVVFSDKHKILTKHLYQLKGYNARQLRTEFPNKGWIGRQVALTGCWRSSETRAQWTDVRAATDREMPARMKTLTRWTIWFWVKRTSPNSEHSLWNIAEDRHSFVVRCPHYTKGSAAEML